MEDLPFSCPHEALLPLRVEVAVGDGRADEHQHIFDVDHHGLGVEAGPGYREVDPADRSDLYVDREVELVLGRRWES